MGERQAALDSSLWGRGLYGHLLELRPNVEFPELQKIPEMRTADRFPKITLVGRPQFFGENELKKGRFCNALKLI